MDSIDLEDTLREVSLKQTVNDTIQTILPLAICNRLAIVFRLEASTPISSLLSTSHFQVISNDVIRLEIRLILVIGLTITLLQMKALTDDSNKIIAKTTGKKRSIRLSIISAVCDREDTTIMNLRR